MSHPLVSVMVITYNQSNYIADCIDSILLQDYPNIEIIIADDASTDGTQDILNGYLAKYSNIVTLRLSTENKGITHNSNLALSFCNGKYIAFTGGDDVFMPNKIAKQVDWLEANKERSLCGHDAIWIDEFGNDLDVCSSDLIPISTGRGCCGVIRHGPPFPSSSMMFRVDNIPKYGFHPKLAIISDWKFMIDIVSDGSIYGFIDGIYLQYRSHPNSVTNQNSFKLYRDQLNTFLLSVWQHRGKYSICWVTFFIFGVRRKISNFFIG